MAHNERDSSRESQAYLRHQHSGSSDFGVRALIPMWDSSDPERAPPPLPLNPQSPSLTSRAGTSSAIQSAHAAMNERARESGPLIPALTKRMNDSSPERAVVKGATHRRMQSMQPGSVRDLSLMIEGGSQSPSPSPTRSSEKLHHHRRPSTPSTISTTDKDKDSESHSEPRRFERESTGSPMPGPSLTPIVRPTVRRPPPQSILGENTPPQSSTMLALQSMQSQSPPKEAEPPLSVVTNGSTPISKPQSLENISSQILSLTSIATALQKEMSQLSRRSRDNATDLLSLKEATTTRDEDIRKGLRDILGNFNEPLARLAAKNQYGGLYLDNKPHNASSPPSRGFQLPRIPSPKSFSDSIDRNFVSTPSLAGSDNGASVALLERIVREMGTREGQETLIGRLNELAKKLSAVATSSKLEELVDQVKAQSDTAVVHAGAHRAGGKFIFDGDDQVERFLQNNDSRRSSAPTGRGADLLNEDLMKIIRSVKDSVAQGGGLTAEVKALVRELRGEVLGMGRELGKRLEGLGHQQTIEDAEPPSKDAVSRVIDEGLEQMKDQLNHVLREHRRQSAASAASAKTAVDYQEIYNAMRAALRDNEASRSDMPDLSREDVLEAVRDAWENYKPEIEVQQLGLEREEVLACLKEGLQEYAPRDERPTGATRDEVFTAVVEGLKHFVPPQMDTPASLSRDEIIEAVRDCLEEFEFPVAASAVGGDMSREDMVYAVKEGLNGLDIPLGRAVAPVSNNEEVLSRLEDMLGYIKLEFRAVSQEAKDNVAANGRDTEQVLDATKDGLENLRLAIESYVDRATGETGQEEFMNSLLRTMDELKQDIAASVSEATDSSRQQLQNELESLREIVNSSMVPATPPQNSTANNKEVLEALHNAVTSLRQEILRPRQETSEILDALQDGLNELRAGIDRMTNKPVDLTANDEILDALKLGLDSVRSDIETIRENTNDRAVAAVATVSESPMDGAVIPADMVKQDDIKNLEVLISQLQIKIEAMGPESEVETENIQRQDLARLEDMLRNVQQGVEEIGSREVPAAAAAADAATDAPPVNPDAASKEDVEAIETILRNTKARLDDLIDGEQALRKEHLDTVEALVLETRESMSAMVGQMDAVSRKEDLAALETLIGQLTAGFDEIKERSPGEDESSENASKTDVEAVETIALEIKGLLDGIREVDFSTLPNKEDLANVETLVKDATEKLQKLEGFTESSSTALEKREVELNGVGERVSEVKTFLEEFHETVKGKLEDGSTGIEAIGKLLETMGEKVDKNENVGTDLKEMIETMKSEFQESKEIVAGAKLESDEKLQEATETLGTKIEDKIGELVAKYDEFQAMLDQKAQAGEARDIETEAAVVGTKAVADELKLLIDTLGSTVTDSLEKMEEASKTVFGKVEELVTRSDEHHIEGKTEHQQTRDSVQAAVTAVEGLQGEVTDFQPKILEALKEVLALVGQHFEHSKSSTTDIQEKIEDAKPNEQAMLAMLPAPDKYDDSEVQEKLNRLVEQRYDDTEIRERLERLADIKYDDTTVHEKLDKLVTSSDVAGQALTQLENLDKVHETVVKTANDISQFLAAQTQRISDEHEDREKTLQDTTISLERKRAEKDHIEASILSLKDEEERLRNSIMGLRTEQESLIRQKSRLTGDVSSLETAMHLRKEELSDMETRAERLERRILEGVMDHSRVLLMSKATKGTGESMNRKRVRKPANEDPVTAKPSPKPVVSMALSGKRNLAPPGQPGTARRIVSLSQINSNSPTGGVKRSQSVRTPAGGVKGFRKRSWGGDAAPGFADVDKENISVREMVEEVDEGDGGDNDGDDGNESDTGTLRRSSRVTSSTDLYTESETGYSGYDDETASEWTESVVSGGGATDDGIVHGDEVVVYGQ